MSRAPLPEDENTPQAQRRKTSRELQLKISLYTVMTADDMTTIGVRKSADVITIDVTQPWRDVFQSLGLLASVTDLPPCFWMTSQPVVLQLPSAGQLDYNKSLSDQGIPPHDASDSQESICIFLPPSEPVPASLRLVLETPRKLSDELWSEVYRLHDIAKHFTNDDNFKKIIRGIEALVQSDTTPHPAMFINNSSGTGKSTLAFGLAWHKLVVYVPLVIPAKFIQPIYAAFGWTSTAILQCLGHDATLMKTAADPYDFDNKSFWTLGCLWWIINTSVVSKKQQIPLEFPINTLLADDSTTRLSSMFTQITIEQFNNNMRPIEECHIVYLDEYDPTNQDHLLCRRLLSVCSAIVIILAGTNTSATDFKQRTPSRHPFEISSSIDGKPLSRPYILYVPDLPSITTERLATVKQMCLDALAPITIQDTLSAFDTVLQQLFRNCRPLLLDEFGKCFKHTLNTRAASPDSLMTADDLLQFLDTVLVNLRTFLQGCKDFKRSGTEATFGQLLLFMESHLKTTVPSANVSEDPQHPQHVRLIHRHFACPTTETQLIYPIAEKDSLAVVTPPGDWTCLQPVNQDQLKNWEPHQVMPSLEAEPLLYLSLTSSLYDANSSVFPDKSTVKAAFDAIRDLAKQVLPTVNTNADTSNGNILESRAAVAVIYSSRIRGLGGCDFPNFIEELCNQWWQNTTETRLCLSRAGVPQDILSFLANYKCPYLSPINQTFPPELVAALNSINASLGNSLRPKNKLGLDLIVKGRIVRDLIIKRITSVSSDVQASTAFRQFDAEDFDANDFDWSHPCCDSNDSDEAESSSLSEPADSSDADSDADEVDSSDAHIDETDCQDDNFADAFLYCECKDRETLATPDLRKILRQIPPTSKLHILFYRALQVTKNQKKFDSMTIHTTPVGSSDDAWKRVKRKSNPNASMEKHWTPPSRRIRGYLKTTGLGKRKLSTLMLDRGILVLRASKTGETVHLTPLFPNFVVNTVNCVCILIPK
jgi:hypothetical protein